MIPSNPIPQVCNYGSSASYCTCPSDEQIANGVVPLDSLPASWWNWMWSKTNTAVNCARYAAGVLIEEVNSVLTQAGVCVNPSCVDQLYRAINNIRQTIGTAEVAGAVKSSSTASEVAIDQSTGKMSVNCLGNAASLATTATTVVGAINELKSTYDTCWSNNTTALSGKAPNNHASTATTYGVGNATDYGHVKLSDQYTSVLSACSGVAASQLAVACVYGVANGKAAVGNTAGCALGTAAAGTATTAARSDHVHPMPTCVACAGLVYLDQFTASADRPVVIACPRGTTGFSDQGVSTTCNFTFNPATGEVKAKTFTGALSGTASCATNAACSARVGVASCTGVNNETLPIALIYASNPGCTGNYNLVMPSVNCLSYNPYFGLMYMKSCFKTACIGHMNTSFLHIYTDAPEIAFNKSIYLPDGCYICRAKYACCASYNGSGTAFGTAATCAATAFRSNTWYPDNKSCGCVKYACCASYDGGGNAFGTAARYNYDAFRPSTWYPDSVTQGCVNYATCACTAIKADRGTAYSWNGRSNVNCNGVWCACFTTGYAGTLYICNCSAGMLVYSIKNACQNSTGILMPGGRSTTVCCMCNTSPAALVWMIL